MFGSVTTLVFGGYSGQGAAHQYSFGFWPWLLGLGPCVTAQVSATLAESSSPPHQGPWRLWTPKELIRSLLCFRKTH